CISLFFFFAFKGNTIAQQSSDSMKQDDKLKSRAELTNYEETTRYEEVLNFIAELQKRSPLLRLESFGKSEEGRMLPLMIISDSPISNPRDARASGKPVVFVMANIHAGEVEGKEAVLQLLRDVGWGAPGPDGEAPDPWPVDQLVTLIAPIYNADGNDRFGPKNRPLQQGPDTAGQRPNAQGLDLN